MATITDYSSLVDNICDWLQDSSLSESAPTFIQLAEADFRDRLFNIDGEQTATSDTIAGDATIALPNGFRELRSLYLDTDPRQILTYMTPDNLRAFWGSQATGLPINYTIRSGQIELGPTPDAAYTANLTYLATLTPLSADNTTNWLLDAYPNLYLYRSLMHAEARGWNDERLPLIKGYVDETITLLNQGALRQKFGGTMHMRPSVVEVI